MTVRLVVTARGKANLKRALVVAVREGKLRTFEAYDRGGKLRHKRTETHPGYITLDWRAPELVAEIRSRTGDESQLLGSFVSMLDRAFAGDIESVTLRFG
jgi:hypothetical protein